MYSVCRRLILPYNDLTLIHECLRNLVRGCNREPKLFFMLLLVNQVSIRVMYSELLPTETERINENSLIDFSVDFYYFLYVMEKVNT